MESLMDNKNGHISTNIQRQNLSIAVFEAAHENPSHERLDRAVTYKKAAKIKKVPPGPGISPRWGYEGPGPLCSWIYIDMHAFVYEYFWMTLNIL